MMATNSPKTTADSGRPHYTGLTHQLDIGHLEIWLFDPHISIVPLPVGACGEETHLYFQVLAQIQPHKHKNYLPDRGKHGVPKW